MQMDFGGEIVWRPSVHLVAQSHLKAFIQRHRCASFGELMQKSTADVAWFWDTMLKEIGIVFDTGYSKVVDLSHGIQRPKWCVGGRMNITASLLDRWKGTPTDAKPAVKWEREEGAHGSISYAELRRDVSKAAAALRGLGIGKGDVVGVFLPMTPECVIAMLAVIRVGGIFLPLFSGYGPAAIISRLQDSEAKALFCCDGFFRRGKFVAMKPVADEAVAACPAVKHVIVHQRTDREVPWTTGRDHWWHETVDAEDETDGGRGAYEVCDADEPCMLIYTSGTTGRPKGAVHTHCGFPVKTAQDMLHGFDLHADETMYWITDIGWMMGPWMIYGTLALGATMMVYDGAMDHPGPDRLWAMVDRHKVTTLGVSPTLIRALMGLGEGPVRKHDVSSLRKFGSTGEPWNPEPWKWLFSVVGGGKLPIINYSGGTEISGGILCGNVLSPMKPCALSGPLPGMAVDILDEHGGSLLGRPGEVGELAIRQPWIGMTRGFWRDQNDERYRDAYWSRFEGVWVHGDWAATDEDGLWYILGRSDDTIKIAGKRLGPAEAESVLVSHPAVREAAAIGVPDEAKGQALVCFAILREGHAPSHALANELSACIARDLGKPLTPKEILFVPDLPRTRNAKIMRRVVRAAYLGQDAGDLSALENPQAVEAVRAAG